MDKRNFVEMIIISKNPTVNIFINFDITNNLKLP